MDKRADQLEVGDFYYSGGELFQVKAVVSPYVKLQRGRSVVALRVQLRNQKFENHEVRYVHRYLDSDIITTLQPTHEQLFGSRLVQV